MKQIENTKNIRVENVVLPCKPLSNFELLEAVKKIALTHFGGFFLSDTLPRKHIKMNVES